MRCGITGPVLRKEFEEKLEGAGCGVLQGAVQVGVQGVEQLEGESAAERPNARVGLISHIGGHKFAGNVIIYIPPGFKSEGKPHPLAGHGIWYGRIEPKHVEGIVKETVIKGNVVADHFRGGIDSERKILRI